MSDLIYPTLDLFSYTLKTSLNTTNEEIRKKQKDFLAQLPPNTPLNDPEIEIEYLDLIETGKINLEPKDKTLEGYYYPVRLNDTYGLQIDCSVNDETNPQSANCFINLKKEIAQNINQKLETIGHTWLLSGWLPEQSRNPEDIAEDCYNALFKSSSWQPLKGKFLGAEVFEIRHKENIHLSREKVNTPLNSQENHVIIIIYPNQESAKKAANFSKEWMMLFCYRSKITWAYWQSRLVKESLLNHYKKVEEERKKDNKNFTTSRQILNNIDQVLQQYTIDLLNLSFQKQIIDINLTNYQMRLALIKEKAGENNQLDFLEKFSELTNKKYLPQINKDIENMQLGLQLLEDTINSIRSRIEVEKSERDRNFQELVAVAGSFIATATLLQSPGKDFCPNNKPPQDFLLRKIPDFCSNPFTVSLIIAFIVGLVVWRLRKRLL